MGQYRHTSATLDLMHVSPVIPVLTMKDAADGIAQAKALVAGGLRVLEVTLRTSGALEAIAAIAKSVPDAIVGAGTVTEPQQIQASIDAGATFLVSPGTSPKLQEAAADSPIPFLPGIATASEAMTLMDLGFRALKFFPAEAAGGVKYLSSLAGPLSQLTFCPTGGIDLAKALTYLAQKNVACVGGSWMVPKALIDAGDWAGIEKLAREAAGLKAA